MLKVIIVDDEKMICSLISQLLDWRGLGYEIVGIAHTGIDALALIIENKPDVIISDIRMPGYDGLELIKRAKEAGVEAEFIMISGFRQFEYAQNAMKYGVKHYLLKPIDEDKLKEIVQEIREEILGRKKHEVYEENLKSEIKEIRDKMRKRFLTSILFSEDGAEKEPEIDRNTVNQEYRTSFKEGVLQAIFIKLDTNEEGEESISSIVNEIEKYITILGEVCEEYITADTHSGTITLFNYKLGQESLVHKKIEELYENVKKYIEQFKGFSVVMGVGEKTDNFYKSNICLKTAMDAVKYRIRIHNAGVIYYNQYSFNQYDIEKIITPGNRQNYVSKLEAGDIIGAEECLITAVREIRYKEANYSPVLIYDILITYVNILTDYCKRVNFYSDVYEKNLKRWNMYVDNISSEKGLLDVTTGFIRTTLVHVVSEIKEKDIKPIRIVKRYIEENFMREINLNRLAELVEMNPSYLSCIFKKETGITYSEYLIQCRVKQAARLLVETNMSISGIAQDTGYQDARYFSKQFLKQMGLKPSEYRKLYS